MDPTKKPLTLGFVFLACGVMFSAFGFATHLSPLFAVGLVQFALAVVFMVLLKIRAKRAPSSTESGSDPLRCDAG